VTLVNKAHIFFQAGAGTGGEHVATDFIDDQSIKVLDIFARGVVIVVDHLLQRLGERLEQTVVLLGENRRALHQFGDLRRQSRCITWECPLESRFASLGKLLGVEDLRFVNVPRRAFFEAPVTWVQGGVLFFQYLAQM